MKRKERRTIRKGVKNIKNHVLFLYGRLRPKDKAIGYCILHGCYLEERDIKEKRCNKKNCKFLKNKN